MSSILVFISKYIGVFWPDFVSREAEGVAAMRTCWKLLPCPTEPMPAGSKTDPLLAKAEPNSDSGSTTEINTLRGRGRTAQWHCR